MWGIQSKERLAFEYKTPCTMQLFAALLVTWKLPECPKMVRDLYACDRLLAVKRIKINVCICKNTN